MKKYLLFIFIGMLVLAGFDYADERQQALLAEDENEAGFVKWMEFDIPLAVLRQAYRYDVNSQKSGETPLDFVQLLAYAAAKNWGNFKGGGSGRESAVMDEAVRRIKAGETLHDMAQGLKLYSFYLEAYGAVLGNFVGAFEQEGEKVYGLKVFGPIAKGFGFSHSDDFGNQRSYGYRRPHLGHDLFGSVGSPVVAVEDGIVEALGWNQYGGWRIGIRSFDNKRYYYYAHLKRNTPYASGIAKGVNVKAGDIIGYLGNSGYSKHENQCNIKRPHLHFGMQIIFDESQKDGRNQIWIDTYNIVRFLNQNRMEVVKAEDGEYKRTIDTCNAPME
jgi:murein DD-endopeptidase MepM/ murein hydrolase activator NlpD